MCISVCLCAWRREVRAGQELLRSAEAERKWPQQAHQSQESGSVWSKQRHLNSIYTKSEKGWNNKSKKVRFSIPPQKNGYFLFRVCRFWQRISQPAPRCSCKVEWESESQEWLFEKNQYSPASPRRSNCGECVKVTHLKQEDQTNQVTSTEVKRNPRINLRSAIQDGPGRNPERDGGGRSG